MDTRAPRRTAAAPLLVTGVVWVVLGLGVAVLLMRLWPLLTSAPLGAGAPVAQSSMAATDWAGLFERGTPAGSAPAVATPTPLDGRLRLLGVAGRPDGTGVAVLSLDGQPPRAYRAGDIIEPGWELRAVRPRGVQVARAGGAVAFEISVPLPAAPGMGASPQGPAGGLPGQPPAAPAVRPAPPPADPTAETVEPAAEPAGDAADSSTAEGPPASMQSPGRMGLVAR